MRRIFRSEIDGAKKARLDLKEAGRKELRVLWTKGHEFLESERQAKN